ncbi:hypothetical protein R4512_05695 [Acinetobacter baumannii]|nr:hypothetical protein [Acinetobacter baumannii]MDV7528103.1 hypothetical protein [Acinetobacter baumannii]
MNKIYISLPIIFILNMSGCATVAQSAPLYEKYESQNLKCGEANVKVISYCYDPEKGLEDRGSGGIVRECKSSVIKINNTQEINIPVMAENQKKLLEKQGYDFSGKLEEGKWSLVSFACIKNNQDSFLLLNQATSNDINMMDHSKGSLWDNPVLLDLKGNIIKNGNKEILKNSKKGKAISANAVYGNE